MTTDQAESIPAGSASDAAPAPPPYRTPWWLATLLWLLAVFLMFSAVVYQRRTGPTYPFRGTVVVEEEAYDYRLIRSEETTRDARVVVPVSDERVTGTLYFKRFKTADEFQAIPMTREHPDEAEGGEESAPVTGETALVAYLPRQPAAGKLEYYVELQTPDRRIPESGAGSGEDENIIIRFKDPVPGYVLWPHVFMMFFSVLIGVRAGLAALIAPGGMRRYAWTALIGMTIGGMMLGPVVQKFAFGEYWTGFPWGKDLTDNKMLIMWVAWVAACSIIGVRRRRRESVGRLAVVAATIVMMIVYLIPHSMRGSELDYSQLDQGVSPAEAIGTGD